MTSTGSFDSSNSSSCTSVSSTAPSMSDSLTPQLSRSSPSCAAMVASSTLSHSRLTCVVRLSARAISRPFLLSSSMSVRLTATSSVPSVSTMRTLVIPASMAAFWVLFPAMILPSLSTRMERPAPSSLRDLLISLAPSAVPLLKLCWSCASSLMSIVFSITYCVFDVSFADS